MINKQNDIPGSSGNLTDKENDMQRSPEPNLTNTENDMRCLSKVQLATDAHNNFILIYDSDMEIEYMIEKNYNIDEAEGNQPISVVQNQQPVEDSQDIVEDEEETQSINWSLNEEITLIDFYREHPSLHEVRSSEYKKSFKSSILEELGLMLNKKFTRKKFIYN